MSLFDSLQVVISTVLLLVVSVSTVVIVELLVVRSFTIEVDIFFFCGPTGLIFF